MEEKVEKAGWRRVLRRLLNVFVLAVNLVAVAGLLLSSYCGTVSPSVWPNAVVFCMTFPAWFLASVFLLFVDFIGWRRTAFIPGIGLLLCIGSVNAFCPLNISKGHLSPEEEEHSFTLMTYNVYMFQDQEHREDLTENGQLAYILEKAPDFVCIEENFPLAPSEEKRITQQMLDSLHTLYPYSYVYDTHLAFLSKREAEVVPLDFPAENFRNGFMACWRVNVNDKVLNIFAVHLRSLYFTPEERRDFRGMTSSIDSLSEHNLREFRMNLIPKLVQASLEREQQVHLLLGYIRRYGGENVIVCGDFNDPVGSYPLYLLRKEAKMREVYPEVGFGPMVTYNANHFFFRIDHVLYRGALKPYSIERGDLKNSDHYPLTVTFVVK